jgi:hypothetical protein
MTDWKVHVPDEFVESLSRAGLTPEASEDEVQDALVGLLSGMRAHDARRAVSYEFAARYARYSIHVGSLSKRLWWSVSSAARRAAADVMNDRGLTGSPIEAQDDPTQAARLGLDSAVLEAIVDLLDGPVDFRTVADERHEALRQDSRWQERDGRETDEALPTFADHVRDVQYERFLESAQQQRDFTSLLEVLPDTERILLDLHIGLTVDPVPFDEILDYFDITRTAFNSRLRRAVSVLRLAMLRVSWDRSVTVEPEKALPGSIDGRFHLPGLVEEPTGPEEAIVEALWAIRGDLPAEDLALIVNGGLDPGIVIDISRQNDRMMVASDRHVALRPELQSLAPAVWRWKRPPGERARQVDVAARILRANRRPMPFTELELAVGTETTTWNLRNVLTSAPQFNRADRDVFALSHWKHEPYDSIEALMRRFIERSGGEASLDDIIGDLTARFTIKASSIRTYAKTDAFVPTSLGTIRNRREDEPVEELARSVNEIPNCFIKDGRWVLRVPIDGKTFRGYSAQIPAGFAHHLKVMRRTSVRIETDVGLEISVVRKGMSDSIGRLRLVAETLDLTKGDLLLIHAPKDGRGPVSFSSITGSELAEADTPRRVALLLGLEDPIDHRAIAAALQMPLQSSAFAIAGAIRSRGESQLASDVLEVLNAESSGGPDADDIAGVLGL